MKTTKLDEMFDVLGEALRPVTSLFPMGAIWIGKVRFTNGDMVELKDGVPVKFTENPTHSIVRLEGTLDNRVLEMDVKDLSDGELSHIKIN
jgi:predicted nucleotidyltransferase